MNQMLIRHWIIGMVLLLAIALLHSCGGGGDGGGSAAPPPDPPGTVTSNLWTSGLGPNTLDLETGSAANCCPNGADMAVDSAVNFSGDLGGGNNRRTMIADVGRVSGLANVSTIPTTGWAKSCAAVSGHGYVIVSDEGSAFAAYVDRFLLSAQSGGIIGVVMKWVLLKNGIRLTPAAFTATFGPGTGQVTASWQYVSGATSYNIYYGGGCPAGGSTGGGPCIPVSNIAVNSALASPYTVNGLADNLIYYFSISAVYPWGESDKTQAVQVSLPVPAGVTATPGPGKGQVTISWQYVSGATSYNVYYGFGCPVPPLLCVPSSPIAVISALASPYTMSMLTSGKIYYFQISAVYPCGEGDKTQAVQVTVP